MNKWIAEFDLEEGDTMPEHMDLNYMGAHIDFHCRPMWIPVSERLPEVMDGTNGECSDDVLICVLDEDGENYTISTGFYGYYPSDITQQGWWCVWAHGYEQLDNKCEVLAWMPLPEPYKESEG